MYGIHTNRHYSFVSTSTLKRPSLLSSGVLGMLPSCAANAEANYPKLNQYSMHTSSGMSLVSEFRSMSISSYFHIQLKIN